MRIRSSTCLQDEVHVASKQQLCRSCTELSALLLVRTAANDAQALHSATSIRIYVQMSSAHILCTSADAQVQLAHTCAPGGEWVQGPAEHTQQAMGGGARTLGHARTHTYTHHAYPAHTHTHIAHTHTHIHTSRIRTHTNTYTHHACAHTHLATGGAHTVSCGQFTRTKSHGGCTSRPTCRVSVALGNHMGSRTGHV